jgi:tol-pal system protein YbgF
MRATLIFVGAGLWALSGCAPQFDGIEEAVLRNGQEIERLQREQALLRQQVEAIDTLLRFDQDAGVTADARGSARLGHLSQKIDQLIQKLDDNASFTRNLSARVDLLTTRAGVSPLGTPAGRASAGELPEEGRATFQAALRDRSRGETELARQGFRDFLGRHGLSELADDASYWLAELDYAEGRHAAALAAFQSLLVAWPATELAPAAELKIGYCQFALGQETQARETLARLIERHPDAEEAALARERLAGQP